MGVSEIMRVGRLDCQASDETPKAGLFTGKVPYGLNQGMASGGHRAATRRRG
jgi:hypothetical protein